MSTHPWSPDADRAYGAENFQIIATGNARVGVQAGKIVGGVSDTTVDACPPGLAADLRDLLTLVRSARGRGEIDAATTADAEHEIGVARAALASGGTESAGVAIRALRKLNGVAGEAAGLGTAVAALVTAVQQALS